MKAESKRKFIKIITLILLVSIAYWLVVLYFYKNQQSMQYHPTARTQEGITAFI